MIWFYATFQKLITPLLPPDFVAGRDLRQIFNERSGRKISGPGFYNWMTRMEDEGIVEAEESIGRIDCGDCNGYGCAECGGAGQFSIPVRSYRRK